MAKDEVIIESRVFHLLFPDLLRPLTDAELYDLRESVKRFGIKHPILTDGNDGVIDGGHRLTLGAELKIPLTDIPIHELPDLKGKDKKILAMGLNAGRRHLTLKDRREAALELRRLGMSYRDIGERLGVDPKTARIDVAKATGEKSPVDLPSTITGRDGKERPAQRSQGKPPEARPVKTPEPPARPPPAKQESPPPSQPVAVETPVARPEEDEDEQEDDPEDTIPEVVTPEFFFTEVKFMHGCLSKLPMGWPVLAATLKRLTRLRKAMEAYFQKGD